MHSWPQPQVPRVGGEPVALKLFDTADKVVREVKAGEVAGVYVCGITPYDATHLGHAATYVAFDTINRLLLDNGHKLHFVENVTDVDDPLFERADRDKVDWRELGHEQTDLFRSDMTQLNVIPPQDYVGIEESVDEVISLVKKLLDNDSAYQLPNGDIYARITATKQFGYESGYDRETMMKFFAERGGDPDTPGKEDPLDALIWRAHREGEPQWNAPFGAGRPGWHVECSAIATNRLSEYFTIQGGGSDLIFPHHEFSAAHYEAASGSPRMAGHYVHTGMISLDGVKMSKSLGNLVFVSKLVADGVPPEAIRLGILDSHYRADRDWSDAVLNKAIDRYNTWRRIIGGTEISFDDFDAYVDHLTIAENPNVHKLRSLLADDLDTPSALGFIDSWMDCVENKPGFAETSDILQMLRAIWGLLGINLFSPIIDSYIRELHSFATGEYLSEEEREEWLPPYDVESLPELAKILHTAPYTDPAKIIEKLVLLNETWEGGVIEPDEENEIRALLSAMHGIPQNEIPLLYPDEIY